MDLPTVVVMSGEIDSNFIFKIVARLLPIASAVISYVSDSGSFSLEAFRKVRISLAFEIVILSSFKKLTLLQKAQIALFSQIEPILGLTSRALLQ